MHQNNQNIHIPVLLEAVLIYLDPKAGDSYLDLTAGYGGHAEAILERTLAPDKTVLVDRDKNAVTFLSDRFTGSAANIVHKDFLAASQELSAKGRQFDMILADVGVSSPHLNTPGRGFSIKLDGPLDMRMDQGQSLTAETIVNSYSEVELADLILNYGEEPRARTIARHIVRNRPITSTWQLAEVVRAAMPKGSKIHPATRTFQALRIAVNSELEQLKAGLPLWIELLAPGGRLAVISFHSLEDRIVKQALGDESGKRYDATLRLLTKHPVVASHEEIVLNPRARSAKLRAAVKIKISLSAPKKQGG